MEVGQRVVRGPDWKWQNQDDGEGHLGTVVEIGKPGNSNTPDKTVVVQWDSGFRTNYRVGYQGAFDLRVFDNAPVGVRHPNIICDVCKKQGVPGHRWKCTRCYDFDLCHECYMADKHDVQHAFMRFENASSPGVKMPKRNGSSKIQTKGIMPGSKVVRGPDWDWGNQDGGEGKTGKVLDIRGWDHESGQSVANVTWSSGSTNVYRLGHKGKVDLKYIEEAAGGHYYRDHLPVLGDSSEPTPAATTHSLFKIGDKVRVDLEQEILKAMQEGHGGWNPRMSEYIAKVGTVHRITERGDVRVQFDGCTNRWTFHAAALTKVYHFAVSDFVQISDSIQFMREAQKGHGEWTDNMKNALGKRGKVLKVYADGDLRVSVGGQIWTFNPACCTMVPCGAQDENNTLDRRRERDEPPNGLAAILEQLLDVRGPTAALTEPDRLVREAAQGHLDIVKDIVAKYPDKVDQKSSGKSALQVACHQGHLEIVKLLLSAAANLEQQDEDGDTALHYSAFGNQAEVTELLLQHGAKVNALNKGGCSTLHVAVNKQHALCVRVLLKHKCDANIQDSYGDTALHDAIGKDNHDIVELLIGFPSIDFTLKNKRGFNVLHQAALKGNNMATERILQKARQTVDSQKDDGFAALHLSALNGHLDVAKTLITVGRADLEIRNNRKQTPLLLSVSPWSHSHPSITELLVSKGARVDQEDEDGNSCLHLALIGHSAPAELDTSPAIQEVQTQVAPKLSPAVYHTGISIACFLAEHKADLNRKNHQNKTPLDIVEEPRIVEILKSYHKKSLPGIAPKPSRKPKSAASPASPTPAAPVRPAPAPPTQECMVCSDLMATVTFDPCGHQVVCSECCARMKKCIVCQLAITEKFGLDGQPINAVVEDSEERRQLRQMQMKMQEMEDCLNCSICMENARTVAFLCGHSACTKCAQPLKVCHMCRKPISKRINLFS